jgi:dihydrofolate synthase/folylpolyglutamate synthase
MAEPFRSLDEALAFLARLTDYERMERRGPWKSDLAGVTLLLEALGRPDRRFGVLHVAGTKGKGSVSTLAEAILRAHGIRTGLYLSPHLVSITERVQIDGVPIAPEELASRFDRIRPAIEEAAATAAPSAGGCSAVSFFDAMTAAAVDACAAAAVDCAVFETGLGGRLDSTNALESASAAITHVGLDHTEVLGSTLEQIAREKCGIFKPGVPAVSGVGPGEPADETILLEARRRSAPLRTVGREIRVERVRARPGRGLSFDLATDVRDYGTLEVPLLGRYQARNVAVAVGLVEGLERSGAPGLGRLANLRLDRAATREALASARVPGRMDVLDRDPLLVADGAHIPEAVRLAWEALRENFGERPRVAVFACARDKDAAGMLRELAGADAVVATTVGSKRSSDPKALAAAGRDAGLSIEPQPDVEHALARARALAGAGGAIFVTGSLYLVGATMARLGAHAHALLRN